MVPAYKALEIFLGIVSKTAVTGAFIVTGYPRNMRDVVEYMARVCLLLYFTIVYLIIISSYTFTYSFDIFSIKIRYNELMESFCWIGVIVVLRDKYN